mmetsp:Transcript_6409/g.14173  ORF Transcript_6409/g.14173 Transcript_6409/m.14173 type:complete len:202 (+) Transcript_6409:167-772(+)
MRYKLCVYSAFWAGSVLASAAMDTVAIPRAPAAHLSAPCTPKDWIDKKTVTTMRLRGSPKRFIITLRWLSGRYLERSVPMEGKYMPTHASNKNIAAVSVPRPDPMVAAVMAEAATASITEVDLSTDTLRACSAPKAVEPSRQQAMKQENMLPKGTAASPNADALMAAFMAGGHCSTNMYIAPSNSACTAPSSRIRLSCSIS